MKINTSCAAICGLFCGTCPSYIDGECGGCLSDNSSCDCFNGFKDCASENNVTRCYECDKFPCAKLEDFSTKHIVNSICHHEHVIEDLCEMKELGEEKWIDRQAAANTCKNCGRLIPWYERECKCKK